MKILYYVSVVSGQRGFEHNVSGHIQIPLKTLQVLKEAGYDVELITTRFGPERTLPTMLPPGVRVHFVDDGRVRGGYIERKGRCRRMLHPWRLARQILQIKNIVTASGCKIIHFWGMTGTLHLAAAVSCVTNCAIVSTINGYPKRGLTAFDTFMLRRAGRLITSTQYVQSRFMERGLDLEVVPHANIRNLREERREKGASVKQRDCVLYWRDLTQMNGADVCIETYRRLAPNRPDVDFIFAVRPWYEEAISAEALAAQYPNVKLYRFPYPPGISLSGLMARACCIFLPFRSLSIDPQMAVVESLAYGVPVITTNIQSNPEYVRHGVNGLLIEPQNVDDAVEAVSQLLQNPGRTAQMGKEAVDSIAQTFSWDAYRNQVVAIYRDVVKRENNSYAPTAKHRNRQL